MGYGIPGSGCFILWRRLLFSECHSSITDFDPCLVEPPPQPPLGSCYFYLAEVRVRLKVSQWSCPYLFELKGLVRVMSLLVSPLLGFQVRLKGLTRVMPLPYSILMLIPLYAAHSLAFVQGLKERGNRYIF